MDTATLVNEETHEFTLDTLVIENGDLYIPCDSGFVKLALDEYGVSVTINSMRNNVIGQCCAEWSELNPEIPNAH